MRSGAQQQQRTPMTDFVQEYATKRKLQIELAKRNRENRLQQQGEGDACGSGISVGMKNRECPSAPHQSPPSPPMENSAGKIVPRDAASEQSYKFASKLVVLQVAEEDFKEATKAGIITPDQARQLWAMLSNQLIRVAPSSRESNNTACLSTTVTSLLALSSSATSVSGDDPTGIKRGSLRSDKKNSLHEGEARGHNAFSLGESISLESLRQSIAHFKEEQQRAANQRHGQRFDAQGSSGHPASQYGRDREDGETGLDTVYDKGPGLEKQKVSQENTKKRPEWNFDVDINHAGIDGSGPSDIGFQPAVAKSLGSRLVTKKANVRNNINRTGPLAKAQLYRESKNNRQYDLFLRQRSESCGSEESSNLRGSASQDNGNKARSVALSTLTPGDKGGEIPLAFDDIPIRSKEGSGASTAASLSLKLAFSGLSRKKKGSKASEFTPNAAVGCSNEHILAEAASAAKEPTRECGNCGRTFRVSVVARHESLCRKQSSKPRKTFDMRTRRLENVEGIDQVRPSATTSNGCNAHKSKAVGPVNQKIPKWRIQHEQFQAAMKAVHMQKDMMRECKNGNANGKGGNFSYSTSPPPLSTLPPEFDDRVPCPHCGRKFAEDVATRHIPKCANTIAKPKGIRPIRR